MRLCPSVCVPAVCRVDDEVEAWGNVGGTCTDSKILPPLSFSGVPSPLELTGRRGGQEEAGGQGGRLG